MAHRLNFRFYMLLLLALYFTMLYVFYGNLQSEVKKDCVGVYCRKFFNGEGLKIKTSNLDVQRHVLESHSDLTDLRKITLSNVPLSSIKPALNKSVINTVEKTYKTCFLSPLTPNRTFQLLDTNFYIYSAFLDERYAIPVIRIMSLLTTASKRISRVFCHFRTSDNSLLTTEAKFYELCENHGKMFGGYILSCNIPDVISSTDVCYVNITVGYKRGHNKPNTDHLKPLLLQVTRQQFSKDISEKVSNVFTSENYTSQNHVLNSEVIYNYTICVPPLFGIIDVSHFVEFIELNRLLGFQHFIIYTYDLKTTDIQSLLDYYSELGIISMIPWQLPDVVQKNKIWYNGQLTVHNDCLYRAMAITKYLAIVDIDEFMVPHNGLRQITTSIEQLINDTICGFSFHSAFYDERFSVPIDRLSEEKLITSKRNGRSAMFSKVRTKVLIKPNMVFEVGIHHVSKPAFEEYQVIPMDKTIAFLHHYRNCVPNYDMKCSSSVVDDTMLTYSNELWTRVNDIVTYVLK